MRIFATLLALLLALCAPETRAQPAMLDEGTEQLSLSPHLQYAVDPEGRADAATMLARVGRGEFAPLPDGNSTLGFSDGAHWFHAELFNTRANLQR